MFFKLINITRRYGGETVLDRVSFSVQEGEIVTLVGPSGVGKTTLLSIIAGLDRPDDGRVEYARPPSKKNPIILVFQDYVLFSNMTVFANVAFGLRARRMNKTAINSKVSAILDCFGLADKAARYPAELSAGQKQRTAIARAMVVEPAVLLLDEPFANLDRNLKLETAKFIRSTQKSFGVTTVAVTHDLEEAFSMSDKLGVLLEGRLVEYDTVDKVYRQPSSVEAAAFLGPVNEMPTAMLDALGDGPGVISRNGSVFVRPEALAMEPDAAGQARVLSKQFAGHYVIYEVELQGRSLTVYSLSDAFFQDQPVRLSLVRARNAKEQK